MLRIRPYTATDRDAWTAYIDGHPEATVFHTLEWRSVITQTFGHRSHYLVAERDGAVAGVLPLFQINSRLFGNSLISVPFAELGGPLADDEDTVRQLLDHAFARGEGLRVGYVELRNRRPLPGLPTKSLYFNFRREILPDPDDNLRAIPRKSRRMVRQGMKNGLTAAFGRHQVNDFYDIMARSYHQLGTPIFSRRLFALFLRIFGPRADLLVIRTPEGRPAAGVLFFHFHDQMVPYYAGSLFEFRSLAPNDYMYWVLLERGCRDGCRWFDFGRSKEGTGSYDFKRHWGFEPTPLAYQYHLVADGEMPNLSPANPKYRRKIELWKKLPHRLSRIIGPPLARSLA
ncbi:MAG: FemAB family PEP-CTERM system-associated protein [Deltaproteobacteria bacterium]|nr:FemAB family PEP-CTERM system-associated protein [Candidatus Anaeroferrophillacea bacterium]